MAGTGLPELKSKDVLAQSPGIISGDRYSSAGAWGSIARSAEQVANTAGNLYGREVLQQQAGVLAEEELSAQKVANDLREKHQFDPKGFETAWQAEMEGRLSQAPTFVVKHMKTYMGSLGERNRNVILNETSNRNTALAGQSVLAGVKATEDDMTGQAMAGMIGTPDWNATVEKFNGQLRTAVATKLMTTEMADLRTEQVMDKAQGESSARSALAVYEEKGPEAAAKHARETILENDKISLSADKRQKAYNRAISAINQAKKEDAADRVGMVQESRDLRERIKGGGDYDMGSVQQTYKALIRHGAAHEANLLVREVSIRETTTPITNGTLTIPQQAQYVRGLRTTPAGAAAIDKAASETGLDVNMLRQFAKIESGGNPNAVTGSYKGLFQMSKEEFEKYGGGNIFNEDDNARAAARKLAAESKRFFTAYGRPATAGDLYLVHQQGEAGYAAHLSNPTAPAWQNMLSTGEGKAKGAAWAKAAIWGNIPDQVKAQFPGGVETVSSAQFVAYWKGRVSGETVKVDPTLASLPSVSAATSQAQTAYVANAKKVWPEFQSMVLEKGRQPAVEDFNAMVYASSLSKDPEWMAQVEAVGISAGFLASGLNQAQRQAELDQIKSEYAQNGYSIDEDQVISYLEKSHKERSDRVKNEPIDFAIDRGGEAPIPLQLGDGRALAEGLKQRSALVQRIAAENDSPVGPALRKFEVDQVKSALETGSLDTKRGIYATMAATLPEQVYRATMEKLGAQGDPMTRFVGLVARDRPELAREILHGMELMKVPATGSKAADVRAVFDDKIGGQLYPSVADQTNVQQAAMAVYTSRRGGTNALYSPTDTAGIEKAIEDVAGKIVSRNGVKVAAPPGMPEATFTTIVGNLNAEQLAKFGGAVEPGGKPIDPGFLSDKAVLKQMEPGGSQYMVAIPNRLARDGLSPVLTSEGGPLVIDVKQMPQPGLSAQNRPLTPYQAARAAARSAADVRFREAMQTENP
jgi:hypothetical protein